MEQQKKVGRWRFRGKAKRVGPECRSDSPQRQQEAGQSVKFDFDGRSYYAVLGSWAVERCQYCHSEISKWITFCPECGEHVKWKVEEHQFECEECGNPVDAAFNFCWSCGLDFNEENEATDACKGFESLEWSCDNDDCEGNVGLLMSFCPWCGEKQDWFPDREDLIEAPDCQECERDVDPYWNYCVFCDESLDDGAVGEITEWIVEHISGLPHIMVRERLPDGQVVSYDKSDPLARTWATIPMSRRTKR